MTACGGWIKGLRCGRRLLTGEVVCRDCALRVVDQVYCTGDGRAYLLDLLGSTEVAKRAFEMQQEHDAELAAKRAERETARQDDVGNVVYYARLGANHIKIGTTGDLLKRMVALRVVNASNLLAAEPGTHPTCSLLNQAATTLRPDAMSSSRSGATPNARKTSAKGRTYSTTSLCYGPSTATPTSWPHNWQDHDLTLTWENTKIRLDPESAPLREPLRG